MTLRQPSSPDVLPDLEPIAPTAQDNAPYQPVGQLIAARLRDAILEGRLRPGARVRQEAVAQRFGVSRIPVREALRQLENEGLVTLVPHSGATVSRLDLAEHTELYLIREALEPIAVAASAPLLTDEQIKGLWRLLAEVEANADRPSNWLEADRRLHLATYAAAPLPRLLSMIEGFWKTTQQYRRAFLDATGADTLDLVHAEHRLLVDALERRDAEDAAARLRSHIRRTRLVLSTRGDMFDGGSTDGSAP